MTRDEQAAIEAETARRQAEVLNDETFMTGVREALVSWARGDKPTPSKDLKRKYPNLDK